MDGRVWQIVVDSFGKLLIPGITVTIPLTLVSFAIGLALAIIVERFWSLRRSAIMPPGLGEEVREWAKRGNLPRPTPNAWSTR